MPALNVSLKQRWLKLVQSQPPHHVKSQTQTSLPCRPNYSPCPTCVPDASHPISSSSKITKWVWMSTSSLPMPVIWGNQDKFPPKCLAWASREIVPETAQDNTDAAVPMNSSLTKGWGILLPGVGRKKNTQWRNSSWRIKQLSWVLEKSKILTWESWNMEWAKGWPRQQTALQFD